MIYLSLIVTADLNCVLNGVLLSPVGNQFGRIG